MPEVVREFVEYRDHHGGLAAGTQRNDGRHATAFLAFVDRRGAAISALRATDLDAFVRRCTSDLGLKTVASVCSSLRAFLRFLHVTHRIDSDLAAHVVAPRVRSVDRPPRALPWGDVLRVLRAIDVHKPLGRRDMAVFLMMATYGMGAGEVLHLTLDDIDWRTRMVRVRRPKTGTTIVLPLLDPIGRALSAYLRWERPKHAEARTVFVSQRQPHASLGSSGALRCRLQKYAQAAGLRGCFLGTHVFRYSHATRQIEIGADAKVVGEILGHVRPASTSVYVRSAISGLREVALRVPS